MRRIRTLGPSHLIFFRTLTSCPRLGSRRRDIRIPMNTASAPLRLAFFSACGLVKILKTRCRDWRRLHLGPYILTCDDHLMITWRYDYLKWRWPRFFTLQKLRDFTSVNLRKAFGWILTTWGLLWYNHRTPTFLHSTFLQMPPRLHPHQRFAIFSDLFTFLGTLSLFIIRYGKIYTLEVVEARQCKNTLPHRGI